MVDGGVEHPAVLQPRPVGWQQRRQVALDGARQPPAGQGEQPRLTTNVAPGRLSVQMSTEQRLQYLPWRAATRAPQLSPCPVLGHDTVCQNIHMVCLKPRAPVMQQHTVPGKTNPSGPCGSL